MAAKKPLVNYSGSVQEMATGDVVPVANGGTGLTSPGASGNVLTSDGTGWVSAAGGTGGTPTDYEYVQPTTSSTLTYTAGVLTSQTETINGLSRVSTYTYTAGVLTQAEIVYNGVTRTETYTYTDGILTSISVTEV